MTQQSTQENTYLEAFEAFHRDGASRDPSWAKALKEAAIKRFSDLGFPTTRRGNEEWKYTDVRPIAAAGFQPLTIPSPTHLGAKELESLTLGEMDWPRLVFVDGYFSEELSLLSSLPDGVIASNLADAMTQSASLVEQHLGHYAPYQDNPFTALNTAFLKHGAFLHIPDGALVEEPIQILFAFTARALNTASHPRVLIVTGKDSKATVIESYVGLLEGKYFTNAVTEVRVGPGSKLTYYKVQRQSQDAFHITNTHAVLTRDCSFSSVNLDFGGALVRNNLNPLMSEEGSSCSLNGLYMPTGTQHVDNEVIVDHAKGYTTTREKYKGVLNGRARSVFHGSIIVRKNAVKVDASQEDKNLLLSNEAEADTKPAFWIYCDDVRCAHGAACGQIDEDALFYLRSRGLEESAARNMLTHGFVADIIDSIENDRFRSHIEDLVQARLIEWLGDGSPK